MNAASARREIKGMEKIGLDNPDLAKKENFDPNTQYIVDSKNNKKYIRGAYLGKGGFAKCYEVTDPDTKIVYACKIVSKSQLVKQHQKEKMASEISIHRSLEHVNIVKFFSHFEDKSNVYILLEICKKRTLLELHKRRRYLTDPEVRYYLHQIILSCKYMHDNCIIHRDLKLGNLFLDDNLCLKVGDFGLAARIEFNGERKKTMCGTPNYIAPEILNKKGHSYEVDIWSIGCIVYTLYVGTPPFETSNIRETYHRIKNNHYTIPSKVPKAAQLLIVKLLQSNPCKRPNVGQLLEDPYFVYGYLPASLPLSSLTVVPRFPNALQVSNIINTDKNKLDNKMTPIAKNKLTERSHALRVCDDDMASFDDGAPLEEPGEPKDFYLGDIKDMLCKFLLKNPHKHTRINQEEAENPASAPLYWITKWIDYTERYGIGYQLSDRSFGVLFNDQTRLISTENRQLINYIDASGVETTVSSTNYHPSLEKKMKLLIYFYDYMRGNLMTAGSDILPTKNIEMIRLPTLRLWARESSFMFFLLNCGILQANFHDHFKFIICPRLGSITYIDNQRRSRTYKFSLLERYGCSSFFVDRLSLILKTVEKHYDAFNQKKDK